MSSKKSSFWDISETGNWNVAGDFTKLKIMKHLYEADEYEIIATFGTSEMIEEFIVDDNTKSIARSKALKRLIKTLQMIIHNTIFAIKKSDKDKMKDFLKDLNRFEKVLPLLSESSFNQQTRKTIITIKEEDFGKILDEIIKIKSDINNPLNNADLIFTTMEEFSPAEAKEMITKDLINKG